MTTKPTTIIGVVEDWGYDCGHLQLDSKNLHETLSKFEGKLVMITIGELKKV